MTIEVHNTADFLAAEAQAKARGQRVTAVKRGKTNSQWILTLSDAPLELQLQMVDNK